MADFLGGLFVTLLWFAMTEFREWTRQGADLRHTLSGVEDNLEEIIAELQAVTQSGDPHATAAHFSVEGASTYLRRYPSSLAARDLLPHLASLRSELGKVNAARAIYVANTTGASRALSDFGDEPGLRAGVIEAVGNALAVANALQNRLSFYWPRPLSKLAIAGAYLLAVLILLGSIVVVVGTATPEPKAIGQPAPRETHSRSVPQEIKAAAATQGQPGVLRRRSDRAGPAPVTGIDKPQVSGADSR
jgi:hypothetical protein